MGGIAMKLTGMLKRYRAALVALVCLVVFMIALPSLAPKAGRVASRSGEDYAARHPADFPSSRAS